MVEWLMPETERENRCRCCWMRNLGAILTQLLEQAQSIHLSLVLNPFER